MLGSRTLAWSLLVLMASFSATSILGCKRDLGECNLDGETADGRAIDGPAAFDVVYRFGDGQPMYEGQALVQSSCAGGRNAFCHSPGAVGAARVGVPAQLNFDVKLACTDASQDPTCAQPIESCDGGQTNTPYCRRLKGLDDNQNQVRNWAEGMIQEIRQGAMPPGEAGRSAQDNTPWVRESDGSELPPIDSDEGQEIVRNWLACQSPVIARTEIATSPDEPLERCASVDDEICVYSGPQEELPDPTWSDIYWTIMFTECLACHGPSNLNEDQNPDNPFGTRIPGGSDASGNAVAALDLSGLDKFNTSNWASDSYSAVVGASAYSGGVCAGLGTLVVPGETANSLLIDKMRNSPPACGTVMPPTGSIAEARILVVEEWIELGAPPE